MAWNENGIVVVELGDHPLHRSPNPCLRCVVEIELEQNS